MPISYKCPNCGNALVFKEGTDTLYCESCETQIKVSEYNQMQAQSHTANNEVQNSFKVYKCSTCGAELLTDEHTSSTFCNYCGTPSLIEDRLGGEVSPAYIIPFKINKDKVSEEFRQWSKKGFFTPGKFKSSSTIEKITGIYVPFWLYDFDARYNASAECTKVRYSSDSEYDYTHTDYFDVKRDISGTYEKIPADASEKMDDEIMDKLEPFKYSDITDFNMPYLSGFLSEKYNYTSDQLKSRAKKRVEEFMENEMNESMSQYSGCNIRNRDLKIKEEDAKYAVLPVWMMTYRYKNQNYVFTMNGQTGKIVGERPISKEKAALTFTIITVLIFVILSLIGGAF